MNQIEEAIFHWCLGQRQKSVEMLAPLQDGIMRLGSNDGTGWQDITQEHIEMVKQQIAELDALIEGLKLRDA